MVIKPKGSIEGIPHFEVFAELKEQPYNFLPFFRANLLSRASFACKNAHNALVGQEVFNPEVFEVLLLQFPVAQPHLHLLHVLDDPTSLEVHYLPHLCTLSPVLIANLQHKLLHPEALLLQGLLFAMEQVFAEGN